PAGFPARRLKCLGGAGTTGETPSPWVFYNTHCGNCVMGGQKESSRPLNMPCFSNRPRLMLYKTPMEQDLPLRSLLMGQIRWKHPPPSPYTAPLRKPSENTDPAENMLAKPGELCLTSTYEFRSRSPSFFRYWSPDRYRAARFRHRSGCRHFSTSPFPPSTSDRLPGLVSCGSSAA